MSIKLTYDNSEHIVETIVWDRDSFFITFNSYWSRIIASIAQKIAENTTDNWGKFNLVRTSTIKILGINPETGKVDDLSSPANIVPLNVFPFILTSSLKTIITEKNADALNTLFTELINKTALEGQKFIPESIELKNLETIKTIGKKAKQILITNDSKENNDFFLKEVGLKDVFQESYTQKNKEQLDNLLNDHSILLTNNSFLTNSYLRRNIKNVLLIKELEKLIFIEIAETNLITINIDGASKGNPGPASIGIVLYKDKEIIKETSEHIGIHTNNYAEYTALIRALEICLENNYKKIEINSDSELVVNQINKKYKVKDADIKDLFDKAYLLINKLDDFKIKHIPREQNLKADKLANNALKVH